MAKAQEAIIQSLLELQIVSSGFWNRGIKQITGFSLVLKSSHKCQELVFHDSTVLRTVAAKFAQH